MDGVHIFWGDFSEEYILNFSLLQPVVKPKTSNGFNLIYYDNLHIIITLYVWCYTPLYFLC